jgi:hypothetical protein
MTPEMLSYYAEELAKNSSRGVVNHISHVKILQGDLAEAWREGNEDDLNAVRRYRCALTEAKSLSDRLALIRSLTRMQDGGSDPKKKVSRPARPGQNDRTPSRDAASEQPRANFAFV